MQNRMRDLRKRRRQKGEKEVTVWVKNQSHAGKIREFAKKLYRLFGGAEDAPPENPFIEHPCMGNSLQEQLSFQPKRIKPKKINGTIKV